MSEQKPDSPVRLIQQLLHLYGSRMRKQAEQERELRQRAAAVAVRLIGNADGNAVDPVQLAADGEFELQLIARAIARATPAARGKLLEALPQAVRSRVQDRMYTFQDLGRLESRSLQKLLMNLDPRTVGLALVGADSTVSRAIFQNISSRTAAVYRDELSYHESADPEDVQKARREVARTLARMVRSGKIADEA